MVMAPNFSILIGGENFMGCPTSRLFLPGLQASARVVSAFPVVVPSQLSYHPGSVKYALSTGCGTKDFLGIALPDLQLRGVYWLNRVQSAHATLDRPG